MPTYIVIPLFFASAGMGCIIGCVVCSGKIADARLEAAKLRAVVLSILYGIENQHSRTRLADTCRVALEADENVVGDYSIQHDVPVYAVGDK
ncbi:hypothetical protein [Xanthobacter versatilis]|uniref:hypothetical protein n=1 Tax=Xanthobacter autotrophicus (strain ATCC BAA-1158 / Py2) TaxID=78245 RepID=UPI003727A5E5